ncbi:hypothetical protein GGE68_002965 [Rhizobium leguminosarum]|uniref:hypothetical protein n=1 Tax=Rhizobium leguminosarum TaxID=384 RepID=UPI001612A4C9|nr:hypothetical protein [Rhizobium leguminosarum]MBB5664768.1 hypothetical protein [Rhizobium leguminosarum]
MTERRAEDGLISVTVNDGKYTIQQKNAGNWEALRYGDEWPAFRDSGPDNLHIALAYEVAALRERLGSITGEAQFLLARLDEINLDDETDDLIRDWNGHVEPSIARLRSLVGAAE